MSTFFNFAIKDEYNRFAQQGNNLGTLSSLIDWERFRPLLSDLYTNTEGKGGRPNYDVVFMIKLMILQQLYGLSDPQLEREVYDRLSFRHFLDYPKKIPDASTIWLFRERLIKTGKEELIWAEFQHQIDQKGLTIHRGVIQDASFITADPGHAPADTPRGKEAKTRRSRDGTWAKKGSKSHFGFKLHILMDKEYQLIDEWQQHQLQFMTAKLISHDPERQYIGTRGISGSNPVHPWIRRCIEVFETTHYLQRKSVETERSTGYVLLLNDRLL